MLVKWRVLFMLACLSLLLVGALYWQKHQWNLEKSASYDRLAWALRRGDDEKRLSSPRYAYLQGRYAECLRTLGQPVNAGERELQSAAFLALLYDLPWPQQLLLQQQIEGQGERPRLLARVVHSGYAADVGKMRLDLLVWRQDKAQKLDAPAKLAGSLKSLGASEDWKVVTELSLVHLDRKDEHLSQLFVFGRTQDGRYRVDVFYGTRNWLRWTLVSARSPRRLEDRVTVEKGPAYKLLEDEWIEFNQ